MMMGINNQDLSSTPSMLSSNRSRSKAQRGREGCLPEVTQLCVGEPRLEPTIVDSEL